METLTILLHIVIAVAIIAFVLLQQGKGAEAGASFGAGASQTLFGSAGSWNFFSRVTAILALVFFATSLGLAIIAKDKAGSGDALTPELRILQDNAKVQDSSAIPGDLGDGSELPGEIPELPGEIPEPGGSRAIDDGEIPEYRSGSGVAGDEE